MNESCAVLIESSLTLICECIRRGAAQLSDQQRKARKSCFTIINSLPIVCRVFKMQAHMHAMFEYVLYYERVRVAIGPRRFLLEGLPYNINIAAGVSVPVEAQQVATVGAREVAENRKNVIDKLENMHEQDPYKVELCAHHLLPDLPQRLPGPVHVLISNCRGIFAALRATRPAKQFHSCENELCGRVFFRGDHFDMMNVGRANAHALYDAGPSAAVKTLQARLGLSSDASDSYWARACGGQLAVERPQVRFCCIACFFQHQQHLKSMLPDEIVNLNADDDLKVEPGRARVAAAFRSALKRNERAARAMRTAPKRPRNGMACTMAEVLQNRARRVCALNVDLGILYAASVLAQSATLSRNLALPGMEAFWRYDETFYSKALEAVLKLYAKNKTPSVITSMLTSPKFMDAMKTKAHSLF